MSEEKTQSLPAQPGSWFLNRGLFSDHFLKARLPQWKEWQTNGELATFRKQLLSLYESTKPILPFLNEPQTEREFVQPVLDLLGYANSYIVQAPTQVGEHTNRPDYALFPDHTVKNKAYEKLKNWRQKGDELKRTGCHQKAFSFKTGFWQLTQKF